MTGRMRLTAVGLALAGILPLAAHAGGSMTDMQHREGMNPMPGMSGMAGMADMPAMAPAAPAGTPSGTAPGMKMPAHHHDASTSGAASAAAMEDGMEGSAARSMDRRMQHVDHQMDASAMPAEHPAAMDKDAAAQQQQPAASMEAMPGMGGSIAMPPARPGAAMQPAAGPAASGKPRDPNAYSDRYTLESGPYALPGGRRLHMADEQSFGMLLLDRLERGFGRDANSNAYDMQAWFGHDYNRLVLKAEGDVGNGGVQDARTELLWGHAVANYWDTQLGVRADSGDGNGRGWLAAGIQGLAPYWFDVEATAYVGDGGRTALRLATEYEVLLTQRLILQPRAELNLYGKRDPARGIGSGLSDVVAGLRLRYEITRQLAPYVGVEWSEKYGETADFARTDGERTSDLRLVAGARLWF